MRKGPNSWDCTELAPADCAARLGALYQLCAEFDVPAVVTYSDGCRPSDVHPISNFMLHCNRALTVIPRGEKPILLFALAPRVYPWIRSVTIYEIILPGPSLSGQLVQLCAQRGWKRIGMLDQAGLPNDLDLQLAAADKLTVVDIPRGAFRPGVSHAELTMHRHAAQLARELLEAQLTPAVIGWCDYELVGRLERGLRLAGAGDFLVLVSGGSRAPLPAAGSLLGTHSSVTVALEYQGCWAKVSRNIENVTANLPPRDTSDPGTTYLESLSGCDPWEVYEPQADSRDRITAIQVMIRRGANRLYYGDTGVRRTDGWHRL